MNSFYDSSISVTPGITTRSPRPLFLALSSGVAFPLERVLSSSRKAFFQADRPRGKNATPRLVLGGLHLGFLHVLHDAGVLLDALLRYGVRAAAGLGDGDGWRLGAAGELALLAAIAGVRGDCNLRDTYPCA